MNATVRTPPLFFVIFWNAFTAVHAWFMLRGLRDSSALFFQLPFYALFFGVGIYMARNWWQGALLRRQYGQPRLAAGAALQPGQPATLTVQFDRAWAREQRLEGRLCWVAVTAKGHSGQTLAESELRGSLVPAAQGSSWQGMGTVPVPPAGAERLRLELLLQPAGMRPGSAWRFAVPREVASSRLAQELTPAQLQQLDKVLRWTLTGLIAVASWQLYVQLRAGGTVVPFRLVFPAAFFLGGWIVHDLREALRSALGAGSVDKEQLTLKLKPFLQRTKTRVHVFLALAVLAFFAEAFGWLRPGGWF
jgi:hypothetical protein